MISYTKTYHVYIMSNTSRMLYTGVTSDLEARVLRRKSKTTDGFTKRYNLHRLAYFEAVGDTLSMTSLFPSLVLKGTNTALYRKGEKTATIAASPFRLGFDMPSIATATQLTTEKDHYRIGDVARITNLKPFVLRYWETEFPMLEPVKSASGHRLYRQQDVDMVLKIKRLLYDEGFTIAGARRHLREHGGPGDSDSLSGASSAEGPAQLLSRKMLLDLRDALRAFLTLLEQR